ncbi:PREDICTED: uncharacterized protein LOC109587395 [Amphimedon queenslandica]|nr:PREDICTED: uncharacterized protein LOC109587395 [Amphimedon queenslandica]|eukprot:XP_019859192.1 PREDICTED: uncharacterized protein LOC109587395 [Amphimedon queenslandica]
MEQRVIKKTNIKKEKRLLCPQSQAIEKFLSSQDVTKVVDQISRKRKLDTDDERKILKAYLLRRKDSFLETLLDPEEDEDDEETIDQAREVFGIPSIKPILKIDQADVGVPRLLIDDGMEVAAKTDRVTWSAEEREALKTLFRSTPRQFNGKKPPVGYISTVLKENKHTDAGKLLISKPGLTAKKIQDNVLRLISKN